MIKGPARSLGAICLIVVVTACGSDEPGSTTLVSTSTSTSSTVPSTTVPETGAADVQAEIDWFVSLLNGGEVTEEEYQQRFSEEFQAQVPYEAAFLPLVEDLRTEGPFTVVDRSGTDTAGEATVEAADGTTARVTAQLGADGRFVSLLIQPTEQPSLEDPPESVAEAFDQLSEMGTLRAIAAEVEDGQCSVVEEVAPAEPAPLGSVFKLYVLAAVGEAISEGSLVWDDEIVIRDELKSIPSGILQDRPAGDTVTVQEATELMISISDNTATDHLMDLVGRETVEAVMVDYGVANPELNTPFPTTRELTALKVGPASGLRVQWIDGDEAERRAILEQISEITVADLPLSEWTEPIDPDLVEWFASAEDLCALAAGLLTLSESVPEIGEILSINPGVPDQSGAWENIWFKGGSEPGLLAMWFVTESEGRTFVTAGSVVNPDSTLDEETAALLFAAARDLLAP